MSCNFFLPKKNRSCRMQPLPGSLFCVEHTSSVERISCPIDPKHSVSISDLDKHVLICHKTKDLLFVKSQKLFNENINLKSTSKPITNDSDDEVHNMTEEVQQSFFDKVSRALGDLIVQALASNISIDDLNEPDEDVEVLSGVEKHSVQNDALWDLIEGEFLDERNICVAEFGCGSGGLAGRIMQDEKTWKYLLVERETRRCKKERLCTDVESVRLRLDLKDADLSQIESVFNEPLTSLLICAKHLCGEASDLALLSSLRSKIPVAFCVATCCHHSCTWDNFVASEIFNDLGLDSDFETLKLMSGWGCSRSASFDNKKRQLGRMIKRMFDIARCLWISKQHKEGYIKIVSERIMYKRFIGQNASPENWVILVG